MDQVYRLAKIAEACKRKLESSALPLDLRKQEKNPEAKSVDEEKLRKALELVSEAKAMANEYSGESKKATNEKMAKIIEVLKLPLDWNKQNANF